MVQAYDPFGERRKSDWTGMLNASERQTLADNQPLKTSRGYTGHEHLDRTGFIHMNGRLYDPQLGRFLSPDPIVAAPGSGQSWNSYSYVSNSPLSFVDPGGQFQAGVGCNVGYVMCMNGGDNTSGRGGGGSGRSTETVTFRTFNFQIGINFTQVPVLRDPIGSIFSRGGGGINDDRNGGIFSDVSNGGQLGISFKLIANFFISVTSTTGTRQIQTTEEEQSPSSVPMGVSKQEGDYFSEIALANLNRAWDLVATDVLAGKHESLLPGLQKVFVSEPELVLQVEDKVMYDGRPAKARVDFSADLTKIKITGAIPHLQNLPNAIEIVGHEMRHLTRANQRLPKL